MKDGGSSKARFSSFLKEDAVTEELHRMKLFSERQFQVLRHAPCPFADPESYQELAELTGELGKPTLLGYLSEREARERIARAVFEKMRLCELVDREPLHLVQRPEKKGPAKALVVALADVNVKYLDTRSENQVIADEVEDKLAGKKKTWQIADSSSFKWESQSQWFIDSSVGVDYAFDPATFAIAPGSTPNRPLQSLKELRDKIDAEEIASSAEGDSHEIRASPDQVGED